MELKKRIDFMVMLEAINSNPNGNPDAGNMPRQDDDTGHGIITDVCIKRKIRDYVDAVKEGQDGYDIYIKSGEALNNKDNTAINTVGEGKEGVIDGKDVIDFMCKKYYDIRTFGAVLTGVQKSKAVTMNGAIKGPVQFSFGRSVDPIMPQEITITRKAVATEEERKTHEHTMGSKFIVPYGLYVFEGHISAEYAAKTGFTEEDVDLLFDALINTWDRDISAARGHMAVRKIVKFEHNNLHGNCPSYQLFEKVHISKKDGISSPRCFGDYEITIDKDMPKGVSVTEL